MERLGRLLDHEIGLRSTLGKGSVFWVKVPLGQAAALTPVSQEPSPSTRVDSPLQGVLSGMWRTIPPPATPPVPCWNAGAAMCRWPPTPRSPGLCRARQCPQLVLLDVHLGQLYGPDVYAQLCERWGRQPPSSC